MKGPLKQSAANANGEAHMALFTCIQKVLDRTGVKTSEVSIWPSVRAAHELFLGAPDRDEQLF